MVIRRRTETWFVVVLIGIDESLKQCILRLKVLLDLKRLIQNGLGILVGVVGSDISCGSLDFLAYHDDGQQNQLQEGLCNPGYECASACVNGFRKADECKDGKGIGAPHGAHALCDPFSKDCIETGHLAFLGSLGLGGALLPELDMGVWFVLIDFHGCALRWKVH